MNRYLSILVLIVGMGTLARTQDVRAVARVDSNSITIGDQVKLHLEVRHPSGVLVQLPTVADSLEGLEIVRRDSQIVQQSGTDVVRSLSFTITSFDSGLHVIPPIAIRYTSTRDTVIRTVETAPIPVFVHGIAVDTSKEIKDIKAPLSLPITFAELLPYIIGILVVAGLVWFVLYLRRKRKSGESIIPDAPPRPAHEVALEALRSLESEKLWQRGKIKEFHSAVTDIVRAYIERRFGVMAMEMTSDEILHSSRIRSLDTEALGRLNDALVRADLVKFAKYRPVQSEHEATLADAFAFVEATWREERPAPKQPHDAEVQS